MWYQLLLCLFIIGMLWYVKDDGKKTKFVLPFSFILITLFFALRYEYGNDYWHYYLRWDSGRLVEGDNRGTGETTYFAVLFRTILSGQTACCSTILCAVLFYVYVNGYNVI